MSQQKNQMNQQWNDNDGNVENPSASSSSSSNYYLSNKTISKLNDMGVSIPLHPRPVPKSLDCGEYLASSSSSVRKRRKNANVSSHFWIQFKNLQKHDEEFDSEMKDNASNNIGYDDKTYHNQNLKNQADCIRKQEHWKYRLEFDCRNRSVGVLEENEETLSKEQTEKEEEYKDNEEEEKEEEEGIMDPHFFDAGYTLAGATGFQVWAGTRILLETLLCPMSLSLSQLESTYEDPTRLQKWQTYLQTQQGSDGTTPAFTTSTLMSRSTSCLENRRPLRIIELGAGVGVVGCSLASTMGAQVLMTDLPTLIDHATYPNLVTNRNLDQVAFDKRKDKKDDDSDDSSEISWIEPDPNSPTWLSCDDSIAIPIGKGWAATKAVDWTKPIDQQLKTRDLYQNVDLIIASDCVWLVSMLDALLDTVASIFEAARGYQEEQCEDTAATSVNIARSPTLLLSFQRRDTVEGDASPMFTTVTRVIQAVKARGWLVECLAWRPVKVETEYSSVNSKDDKNSSYQQKHVTKEEKEVFVFAINPPEL